MTDQKKSESEPSQEDEELTLEKEKLRDLDVPAEEGEDVKGGAPPPTQCSGKLSGCF